MCHCFLHFGVGGCFVWSLPRLYVALTSDCLAWWLSRLVVALRSGCVVWWMSRLAVGFPRGRLVWRSPPPGGVVVSLPPGPAVASSSLSSGTFLQWLAWICVAFSPISTAVWVVRSAWHGPYQRLECQRFLLRSLVTTQSAGTRSWSVVEAGVGRAGLSC